MIVLPKFYQGRLKFKLTSILTESVLMKDFPGLFFFHVTVSITVTSGNTLRSQLFRVSDVKDLTTFPFSHSLNTYCTVTYRVKYLVLIRLKFYVTY